MDFMPPIHQVRAGQHQIDECGLFAIAGFSVCPLERQRTAWAIKACYTGLRYKPGLTSASARADRLEPPPQTGQQLRVQARNDALQNGYPSLVHCSYWA